VKVGQVNFCDATAAHCTDVHILATAQLTSSGTATYTFRPGIGGRSYKAVFVGTKSYAGSNSSVSSLTVTGTAGPFATSTWIAETGAWGNYTLTGTVTEAGGTVAPTGTLSFRDASNGNSVLGTASLGAAVAGVGWPNPKSLPNTQGTNFVLVADLNRDGIPDLVLGSNQVTIYLGKSDGTYTKLTTISVQQGPTSYPILIADFNGDGIPDLAVPMYGLNEIAILKGKGDGTFALPIMALYQGFPSISRKPQSEILTAMEFPTWPSSTVTAPSSTFSLAMEMGLLPQERLLRLPEYHRTSPRAISTATARRIWPLLKTTEQLPFF
jgi:hypothetical protein